MLGYGPGFPRASSCLGAADNLDFGFEFPDLCVLATKNQYEVQGRIISCRLNNAFARQIDPKHW